MVMGLGFLQIAGEQVAAIAVLLIRNLQQVVKLLAQFNSNQAAGLITLCGVVRLQCEFAHSLQNVVRGTQCNLFLTQTGLCDGAITIELLQAR